jgi:hypothetical protein
MKNIEMKKYNLQPLNIPANWIITYNNFFDIDPLKLKHNDILWDNFIEDLLQLKNEHKNILLDLGWYPEMNPNGNYCMKLIQDNNWEEPLMNINNKDKNKIIKIIENILLNNV